MDVETAEQESMRRAFTRADNRLDNLGTASSFVSYGPGWAAASAAPSWLYKTYATEGGTRTASFIAGPSRLIGTGRIANVYVSAADVTPTVLALAGIAAPQRTFEGRAVEPIQGASLLSYLIGGTKAVHRADEVFGTKLFGSRSIRRGDWKITDTGDGIWHLFSIVADPGETRDPAGSDGATLGELIAEWDRYVARNGVVMPTGRFHSP